jgi:putative DNA primase/helicase
MSNPKKAPPKLQKKTQYENLLSYCDVDDINYITTGKNGILPSASIPCFACGQKVIVDSFPDRVKIIHNSSNCSIKLMLDVIGWATNDLIEKPGRPPIQIDNQTSGDLPHMIKRTLGCLKANNNPPSLFQFQGQMLRTRSLDGKPIIEILDDDKLEYELSQRINFFRLDKDKHISVLPPKYVIRGLRSCPDIPLPRLERIIESPTFTRDGKLHKIRGYSPHSHCYYSPSDKLKIKVPAHPSDKDVQDSLELIQEVFCDFPILGDSSLAHHLATVLTPFARTMIEGPVPITAYNKPKAGTGATLIVDAISLIAIGRVAEAISACDREDEWDKKILSVLRNGPQIILIDNLRGKLDSGVLAQAITRTTYTSRELSRSKMLTAPNYALWIVTGNNIKTSDEMTRRIIFVQMDSNLQNPELRNHKEFKHPNLISWIRENRSAIVSACLTIINRWIVEGRPLDPKEPSLGMFEDWSNVMGGILYSAGIKGFLDIEDLKKRRVDFDTETTSMLPLIHFWWGIHKDKAIKVSDLVADLSNYSGTEDIATVIDLQDKQISVKLGLKIAELKDQVFDLDGIRVKLVNTSNAKGSKHYKLTLVENASQEGVG